MPENKKDPIFPNGIIFKKPKEGAPEWIRGGLSFKVAEACEFLKKYENNGWVNIDIKKSKEGKTYLQLNDWKPERKDAPERPASFPTSADIKVEDSPF
jgi:hypothetical protein